MKASNRITLFLLFSSPIFGEIFSGSTPLPDFFNPIVLLIFLLLYGCGTLLIRELKVRWKLGWSVVFLAVAYGVIEEGLSIKSFFNPGHEDVGVLSEYGLYVGVQWVWTLLLALFHATISTLIPIAISEMVWPEFQNRPLVGRRGFVLACAGLTLVTLFGMLFFGPERDGEMMPYHPHPLLLVGGVAVTALLIGLAYRYRRRRLTTHWTPLWAPWLFGLAGFGFQFLGILVPFALAETQVPPPVTILYQIGLTGLLLLFGVSQVCHRDRTPRHLLAFASGSLSTWVLFAALQGNLGALAIGALTLTWLAMKSKGAPQEAVRLSQMG